MATLRYFDRGLFSELTAQASASPRRRQHRNFHRMEEPCHRLAIGLQPDTYIAPHRHLDPGKAETLIVLQGCLGLLIFSEDGQVIDTRRLQAGGDCCGADLPSGVFHALVVLEADSVLFECKAGPYRPLAEGELADWAPREGEARVGDYLASLRAHFS